MVLKSFLPQRWWLTCRRLGLGSYGIAGWYLENWLHIFRLKWFFGLNRLRRTKSLTKRVSPRSNGVPTSLRTNSTIHLTQRLQATVTVAVEIIANKTNRSLINFSGWGATDGSTCVSTFQIAVDRKPRSGSHWIGRWLFPAYNRLARQRPAAHLLRFPRSATALS